jgi:thimet oligopeptidase
MSLISLTTLLQNGQTPSPPRKASNVPGFWHQRPQSLASRFCPKEVLLQKMFSGFDSSHIRPYLRVRNVLPQITMLIQELFGVQFKHQPEVKSWVDTGVSCYDVYDVDEGRIMGRLYTHASTISFSARSSSDLIWLKYVLQLHPRDNKYSHACVCIMKKAYGKSNLPEVILLANVPEGDDALMTYAEVSTLYHE